MNKTKNFNIFFVESNMQKCLTTEEKKTQRRKSGENTAAKAANPSLSVGL